MATRGEGRSSSQSNLGLSKKRRDSGCDSADVRPLNLVAVRLRYDTTFKVFLIDDARMDGEVSRGSQRLATHDPGKMEALTDFMEFSNSCHVHVG